MPAFRGRGGLRKICLPRMPRGTAGEVAGGGGVWMGVGTGTMQCFEEEMGKEQMPRRSQGKSAKSGLGTSWPLATKVESVSSVLAPVSLE